MCEYKDICPAYDERCERCTEKQNYKFKKYIPLILEAYHNEKGTPYNIIKDSLSRY